jgi:hypothetical protein
VHWLSTPIFHQTKQAQETILFRKLQFIIWLEIFQLKVEDKFFKIRVQGPVATTGLEQMVVLECMLNISQLCLDQIQTGGEIN